MIKNINMKKIYNICLITCGLLLLTACGDSSSASESKKDEAPKADRETIYQVSLLQGLTLGDYNGSASVKELKQKGDTGIGTFEGVNGELIMVDGTVYRAKSDGSIETAPDDETIPFANVTFFDTDEKQEISGVSSIADIKKLLDEKDYIKFNREYSERIDKLTEEMNELQSAAEKYEKSSAEGKELIEIIRSYRSKRKLSKELVDAFVDKVIIYENKNMEVVLKFEGELKELEDLRKRREAELA